MTSNLPKLRQAMDAIAQKKGDFALFGMFMRADAPGRWDLVVAAPWLEVGRLKTLSEFLRLLEEQLGKREVRQFAGIITLKASSPEIREELTGLDIDGQERHLYNTMLFGADVQEAIILRAKAPRARAPRRPAKARRQPNQSRRADGKKRSISAVRG